MKKKFENIGVNFIMVLKILSTTEKISFTRFYQKLKSNELMKNYKRAGVYSILRRMEKKDLIKTYLTKTTPPDKIVQITFQGKQILTQYINLISNLKGEKAKENIILEPIKEKKVFVKEIRDLDDDELAELTQDVIYGTVALMNKELEKLSDAESEKIANFAMKIVKRIRNY